MESTSKFPNYIEVSFIPTESHRYPTVGDYGTGVYTGNWWFKITRPEDLGGGRLGEVRSIAILLHEIVEKLLKDQAGISDKAVDEWDMGPGAELDDPGTHPDAPYHRQHMLADTIERVFITLAGYDWAAYEEAVNRLFTEKKELQNA